MDNLKVLNNIWISVITNYIFIAIVTVFIARYSGLSGVIIFLLIELFLNIRWWINLKSKLLKGMIDEFQYVPTTVEDFDFMGLDTELIDRCSEDLVSLEFVQLMQFQPGEETTGKYLSRIFAHSEYYCFAEVGQVFPINQEPLPILFSIHSSFQDEWMYSSTTAKPNGLSYMWRNHKGLWTYHPSANAHELLEYHLQRRQQIQNSLGVEIIKDISWDFYVKQSQLGTVIRKQNLKRKNIVVALIEATLFEMNPPTEWMGRIIRSS